MKSALRRVVQRVVLHDSVNRAFEHTLGRTADYLRVQRRVAETAEINRFLQKHIPNNHVLTGPFAGLAYPALTAIGSALYPKLLGTYENELHETLDIILRTDFDQIIDIGCAEGYYAVGLARRFPQTPVLAFDLNPAARESCRRMAEFNDAARNLTVEAFCNPAHLASLCSTKRNLVISDCEGFEEHLFSPEHIHAYENSSLVIEIHDFFGRPLGDPIKSALARTHSVATITALPTERKIQAISDSHIGTLPDWEQKKLVSEQRPEGMYWIVATPNSTTGGGTNDGSKA